MLKILPALRPLLFALVALSCSAIAGGTAGCGLKGDLVLPDSTEPARETESEREGETDREEQTDRQKSIGHQP
jgi:predicted small lipoprotein YifL